MTAVSLVQREVFFRPSATTAVRAFGWFSAERQLPAPNRLVVYQTQNAQKIGYLDTQQQWRCANGAVETEPVISWTAAKAA
jgi:hypothetical protein